MIDGRPRIDRRRPSPLNEGFNVHNYGHCALFNVTLVFSAEEHRLPKRLQKQSAVLCILSQFVHACKSCFWYPRDALLQLIPHVNVVVQNLANFLRPMHPSTEQMHFIPYKAMFPSGPLMLVCQSCEAGYGLSYMYG